MIGSEPSHSLNFNDVRFLCVILCFFVLENLGDHTSYFVIPTMNWFMPVASQPPSICNLVIVLRPGNWTVKCFPFTSFGPLDLLSW